VLDWPPPTDVPDAQRASGDVHLRYEDVSEDGRLTLHALPQGIGQVFWRKLAQAAGIDERMRHSGIVPILTRLVTVGGEGPLGVFAPLQGSGSFELARDDERFVLRVWVALVGPRGRVHGPPPEGAGEAIVAGRVYAEHTFTRLFAPAGERRVTALESPIDIVERPFQPPEQLLSLPEGAKPLDALSPESEAIAVGLDHTDANQHVNSLVYPRWIREAALRRLAALGHDTRLLARFQDTAFRKPVFAGNRMVVWLRAFLLDGRPGAVACMSDAAPELGPPSHGHRAHCYGVVGF
jgi:hypothetical protein